MEDLLEHGAARLVELIVRGELSSVELTRAHLAQIEEVNPRLNAVVTLEPERALQEARAADARRSRGEPAGLLHGLPMTHKDTHDVAGMRTTQGSPLFADHVPEADDPLIARLRRAGVVSTGKTNVPEFAAGPTRSTTSSGPQGTPTTPRAAPAVPREGWPPPWPPGSSRWGRAVTWAALCATPPAGATSWDSDPPMG